MKRRELLKSMAVIFAAPGFVLAEEAAAPTLWVPLPSFVLMGWHGEALVRMMRVEKGPLAPGWRWRCNGMTDYASDEQVLEKHGTADAFASAVWAEFGSY